MISLRQRLTYLEVKLHDLRDNAKLLTRIMKLSKELDRQFARGLLYDMEHTMTSINKEVKEVIKERKDLIAQIPTEPTFQRIADYYGPLFANKHMRAVRIEEPHFWRTSVNVIVDGCTWRMVLASPEVEAYHGQNCEIITHRKLIALLRIDRWLKKNHDHILAKLYHPSGSLAQKCVQRAMDLAQNA